VPVHGAPQELLACIASVRRHTDLDRHRLIVVADGPQDAATEGALAGEVSRGQVELVRQPQRRGFAAAVNRGIEFTAGDVVLLNSDTVVTEGWIEKLAAAVHSAERVASATPFSNSATICSLPRWLEDNAIPAGWTIDRFAALVAEESAHEYPNLPTGVGVCMYLRREAIAEVGLFDEAFGLGYGEEVDWCRRAVRLGWGHVLDDATFIFHAGQASFGAGLASRVRAAHRRLRRGDPTYWPQLAAFLREDPLRAARARVLAALRATGAPAVGVLRGGPRRVLHVVHGWPPWSRAGTELYAAWLARWQAAFREVTVFARIAEPRRSSGQAIELLDKGARVRLLVNNFDQRNPLARNAIRDRRVESDFAALLDSVKPQLVHLHHLAGHSATLARAVKRRGLPLVYQLQDWTSGCARANLFDRWRRLCRGPGALRCARCLPLTGIPPARLWSMALHVLRRSHHRQAISAADVLLCGSRFLARSFDELGWLPPGAKIEVLPYATPEVAGERFGFVSSTGPLRCGILGSWLPHKGIHVALAAWRSLPAGMATLRLWGTPGDPGYLAELRGLATPDVRFEPPFEETEIGRIFSQLDLLIAPSLGLESFGLAAREALAHGVPILVARRGALTELLEAPGTGGEFGACFDPEQPGELAGWVQRLASEPQLLQRWRSARPALESFQSHAEEIEAVYSRLSFER